ncbi:hypothetical protein GJW-30_1_00641 [Variibacter gotjawalensis]|uniref:DUF2125 domain-containing protein n=1 Tax=Variibacter gotjawalensis TaxID=1333996 RepID=A0A0S3PQG8_9BRAD|nr:DUF2125 domain-containing protein [Variibacter gotjawalensis]NIK48425.1 hypothetical protein [Variibacter gotjawalensis]RZS50292.1 hypothetical protein EV661_2749 [Variibacter gotjawalensis]BAT58125.1 hypothetical protein GJW-30_1_00641 [Variibacter gotjawalensis]
MSEGRRSRFWLYAPFVALAVLAAGWTAVWFYAAQRADTMLAAWMAREAVLGRQYHCGQRKTAGYPFRIEVTCTDLKITFANDEGPVTLAAPKLLALAQIYTPDLVILEATGPMTVKQPATGIDYVASWTMLQASARGRPSAPQRLSLVVTAPKLALPNRPDALMEAKGFQFHAKRQENAADPIFDLALNVDTLTSAAPALTGRPLTGELVGVLRGLKDLRPKPWPARLREWQGNAGRVELTRSRITLGDAVAVGQGDLGLTPQGRLDGTVNLRVAGLEQIAGLFFASSESRPVITALNMLARSDIDGKKAVAVPLSFRDGRILFGPVPVGRVGPLF